MAQTDRELAEIISNMATMGWPMKIGHAPDTVVVYPPNDQPPQTLSLRGNRGDGKRQALALIKRMGYAAAWEQHNKVRETVGKIEDEQVDGLLSAVAELLDYAIEQPRTPQPNINVSHDGQLLVPEPRTEPDPLEEAMTTAAPAGPTDRTQVNGVAIKDRAPAKARFAGKPEPVEVNGVDEILLENDTIMYQCVRSAYCFFVSDRPEPVVAHLRGHGRPQAAARADKVTAQRSAAGTEGQRQMRARRALLVGEESRAEWLASLAATLLDAAPVLTQLSRLRVETGASQDELDAAQAEITELQEANAKLNNELKVAHNIANKLANRSEVPVAEIAELRRKAEKWDAFVAARDAK